MQHGNVSRVLVRERPRHTRETRRPPRAPHGANPSMAPKRGSKVQKVSHETRAPTRGSKKTRRIEETPNILTRSIFFYLLYVIPYKIRRVGAGRVDLHQQTTGAFLYVYCRSQIVGWHCSSGAHAPGAPRKVRSACRHARAPPPPIRQCYSESLSCAQIPTQLYSWCAVHH